MREHRRIPVIGISVGCCAALWTVLLLWYHRGLDPTDVMGYGILAFLLLWPAASLLVSLLGAVVGFRWKWVFPICFGFAELLLSVMISGSVQGILFFLLPATASLIGIGTGVLIHAGFHKTKKQRKDTDSVPPAPFDRSVLEPALRCSICTGEQVAGFLDRKTGKFQEVAAIKSKEDLEKFLKNWQISEQELKKIY